MIMHSFIQSFIIGIYEYIKECINDIFDCAAVSF